MQGIHAGGRIDLVQNSDGTSSSKMPDYDDLAQPDLLEEFRQRAIFLCDRASAWPDANLSASPILSSMVCMQLVGQGASFQRAVVIDQAVELFGGGIEDEHVDAGCAHQAVL